MVQESKNVGQIVNSINNRGQIVDGDLETLQGLLDTDDDNDLTPRNVPVNNQGRSDENENQNKESIFDDVFARIETYFNSLTRRGLGRGYYPEPSESVLIVHPENFEAGKDFGARHGFKACTGAHYLWGLHRGRRVQKRLAERAYADVGEKN